MGAHVVAFYSEAITSHRSRPDAWFHPPLYLTWDRGLTSSAYDLQDLVLRVRDGPIKRSSILLA